MKRLINCLIISFSPLIIVSQIISFPSDIDYFSTDNSDTFTSDGNFAKDIHIDPRYYLLISNSGNEFFSTSILGLSFSNNINHKVKIKSEYDYLFGNHNYLVNDYRDSLQVFPEFNLNNQRWHFNLNYSFNDFVSTDVGNGKHFIGDGYRSLFLSSAHSSYPYLKLNTKFGKVRYYNLYTTFLDIRNLNMQRKKHASIHVLDFKLSKNFNIGIFESVLWQASNEYYNRGYDIEYLNPIIFYRPVEFSKNSPDNVLMGANLRLLFSNTKIYSQILLDDLNISRQKDSDKNYKGGFFQNKFAYQLGVKFSFKSINSLIEYNQVQPYTYAHKESMQSYTHMNQALAHPLGANFKEIIFITNYPINDWIFNCKLTLAKSGLDSNNTHYGQDIFTSDFEAQGDNQEYSYGNYNGQGVLTDMLTAYFEASYSLKSFNLFGSVYYVDKKSDLIDHNYLWLSIGIRNFPFSAFKDY